MLKVNLRKDVIRFLEKLPPKQKNQVARKIWDLREIPIPPTPNVSKANLLPSAAPISANTASFIPWKRTRSRFF